MIEFAEVEQLTNFSNCHCGRKDTDDFEESNDINAKKTFCTWKTYFKKIKNIFMIVGKIC